MKNILQLLLGIAITLSLGVTASGQPKQLGVIEAAAGGDTVDPTKNVLDLVAGQVERLNDLRKASEVLMEAKILHIRELGESRSVYLKEISDLRAMHVKEIQAAETARLNAIRQVDQLNVTTAAGQAEAAIRTLAEQTATNADNIQKALTATAATIATQTATTVSAMTERIAALEKAAYTGEGRSMLSDPAMAEVAAEMRRLTALQASSAGQGQGKTDMSNYIIAGIGVVVALIAIYTFFRKNGKVA